MEKQLKLRLENVDNAITKMGSAFSSSRAELMEMSRYLGEMKGLHDLIFKAFGIPESLLAEKDRCAAEMKRIEKDPDAVGYIAGVKTVKEAKYTANFKAPSFPSIEATGTSHVEKTALRVEGSEDESWDDFLKGLGARETVVPTMEVPENPMMTRAEPLILPADDPDKPMIGVKCFESIGRVVVNGEVEFDCRWYEEKKISDLMIERMMREASE